MKKKIKKIKLLQDLDEDIIEIVDKKSKRIERVCKESIDELYNLLKLNGIEINIKDKCIDNAVKNSPAWRMALGRLEELLKAELDIQVFLS